MTRAAATLALLLCPTVALGGLGEFDPVDWRVEGDDTTAFDVLRDSYDSTDGDQPLLDEDGCPVLLIDEICSDPAFWQTSCGARELEKPESPCQDEFWDYLETAEGSLPAVPVVDPRTGEITVVQFEGYDPSAVTWSGFDTTYAPHLLKLTHPRNDLEPVAAGFELLWWDTNCSVQSCAELAFERYEDYSRFEARVASELGEGDWRGVYEEAYGAEGIARRELSSRTGIPLPGLSVDTNRASYLDGFVGDRRGPLYDFSATYPVENRTLFSEELDVVAVAPLVLHALGELPVGMEPDEPDEEVVDRQTWLAFEEQCHFDHRSALVACTAGADPLSLEVRDAFNLHLFPFDAGLVGSIPGHSTWPAEGTDRWDFHQQTGDSLAHVDDRKLLWLEDRQAEFGVNETRRYSLWRDLIDAAIVPVNAVCTGGGDLTVDCPDPTVAVPELLGELEALHIQQSALLTAFETSGCLAAPPTPCDWSPRWFGLSVVDHFQGEREDLYAECIERTGDDFSVLRDPYPDDSTDFWLVSQDAAMSEPDFLGAGVCDPIEDLADPGPHCRVRSDYLANERQVLEYFDAVDAWADKWAHYYEFPVDRDTGLPKVAGSAGDRSTLGGDDFGASLVYDAGWNLPELADLPCALGASVHGQLQVGTRVFGEPLPPHWFGTTPDGVDEGFEERRDRGNLLFADVLVEAGETSGASWAVFDVLGVQIHADIDGADAAGDGELTWHYSEPIADHDESIDLYRQETTTMVGPVPVNLEVGVVGSVGYTAAAELDVERCPGGAQWAQVSGTARFTPFASATAVASASAGVDGLASIGVDANLTVARVDLPVSADVTATWDPDALRPQATGAETSLDVTAGADLEVALLTGRVRAFVEVLFKEYARTLFTFDGWRYDDSLFDLGLTADLTGVRSALGLTGPADPEPAHGTSVRTLHEDRGTCESFDRSDPDVYVDFDDQSLAGTDLEAVLGAQSWDVSGASVSLPGRHGQAMTGPLVPDATVFPLGDELTWSLHFRPDSADPGGTLLAHGTGGAASGGVALRLRDDRHLTAEIACAEGGTRVLNDEIALAADAWHHAFLNVTSAGHLLLWVDGRYADWAAGCNAKFNPSPVVHLGRLVRNAPSDVFSGRLDEFAYWGSADLSGFDAADLNAQGEAGLPVWGSGTAPLSGITAVEATLVGTDLDVSWTNPPGVDTPNFGYDEVVIRFAYDGYPVDPADGVDGYVGTAESASLAATGSPEKVYLSTWARGPAGVRPGPQLLVSASTPDLPEVTDLVAQTGSDAVRLRWTLPADPRVARVLVVRDTDPVTAPIEGTTVSSDRTTEALDVGLTPDQQVHYTVWAQDGHGGLSDGVSITATPTSGSALDSTPPGPLSDVLAEALPTKTVLSWALPVDDDLLEVEVRRVDYGWLRRTLDTVLGGSYSDADALLDVRAVYELTPLDPAGNRGPTAIVETWPRDHQAPSGFAATPGATAVDLSWTGFDPDAAEVVVVRTEGTTPADLPSQGDEICRVAATSLGCTDTAPPPGTDLAYAAFAVDAWGALSLPATDTAKLGEAGPDRLVHVGERVALQAAATETCDAITWTSTPELPLVAADTPRVWFVPRAVGTYQVRLQGTGACAIDDTAEITVQAYGGGAAGWQSNPFVDLALPGEFDLSLVADGSIAWATTPAGDRLLSVDAAGTIHTDVSAALGTFPPVRGIHGDYLLMAEDESGADLVAVDLAATPEPTVAWTEESVLFSNGWDGNVAGGRIALRDSTPNAVGSRVEIHSIGADGLTHLGDVELGLDESNKVALSPDGNLLAVATSAEVQLFVLSGLDPSQPITEATETESIPRVDALAWEGTDALWTASRNSNDDGPSDVWELWVDPPTCNLVFNDCAGFQSHEPWVGPSLPAAVLVADGVVAVQGRYAVSSWDTSGADPVALGTASGVQPHVHSAALLPTSAPTHVAIASDKPVGVNARSSDGVRMAPVDGTALSYVPRVLTDTVPSSGRIALDDGTWAMRSSDSVSVGDLAAVRFQDTVGSNFGPAALDELLCLHEGQLTWVADDNGAKSLHTATVGASALGTPTVWSLEPTGCTQQDFPASSYLDAACTADALVLACQGSVQAYEFLSDTAGNATRGDSIFVGLDTTASLYRANQHDVFMLDDNAQVWGARVGASGLAERPWPDSYLGAFLGKPMLLDDHLWGQDSSGVVRYDMLQSEVVPEAVADTPVGTTSDAPDARAALGIADGGLLGWRGDGSGLLLGSWIGPEEVLTADAGDALVVQRDPETGYQGVALVRTSSAWIDARLDAAPSGSTQQVAVTWEAPLLPACSTDCPDPAAHVDLVCAVTAGSCQVTSFDAAARTATVEWTLPATTGDHELSVAVGTPRWFATAIDRVTVESP